MSAPLQMTMPLSEVTLHRLVGTARDAGGMTCAVAPGGVDCEVCVLALRRHAATHLWVTAKGATYWRCADHPPTLNKST